MANEQTAQLASQSSSPAAPVLSLISGLVILGLAGLPIYRSLTSWFWPAVEGQIQSAQVLRNISREAQTRRKPFYYTVSYQYMVDGVDYSGRRAHFEAFRSDEIVQSGFVSYEAANEAVNTEHPPNGKVTVYHHPGNPQLAVLKPGFTTRTYIVMALITGLFFYGGYGLIQWSQNR